MASLWTMKKNANVKGKVARTLEVTGWRLEHVRPEDGQGFSGIRPFDSGSPLPSAL